MQSYGGPKLLRKNITVLWISTPGPPLTKLEITKMSFKTALAHSNSKANNNPFANIEIE
jgi:hypothetical protein